MPYGLCWCGCDQQTPVSGWTDKRRGTVKGSPTRFIRGHEQKVRMREQVALMPEPNPSGLCLCGCGQPTPLAKQTDTSARWVKGKPVRYLLGHASRQRNAQQEAEAVRLYQSGKTCKEVGEQLGASREYVSSVLKRQGVELRPHGWSARGRVVALTPSQEVEAIQRYQAKESGKAIAKSLGVSEVPIYATLKRQGVRARPSSYEGLFNRSEEQLICQRYLAGELIASIADKYNVSYQSIWKLLKRNGVAIRPRSEMGTKYYCDHGFFDAIDTEEKAYWLGFLAADGYVSDGDSISLRLQPMDAEHLYRFKYALKSTHPVTEYSSQSTYHDRLVTSSDFTMGSARLVRGLSRNGVTPRKTFTLKWPEQLGAELLRHFLRGMVDGDGSLGSYVRKGRDTGKFITHYAFSLISSQEFVEGCQNYLVEVCGLGRTRLDPKKGSPGIATVRYGGRRQVERIFHLLYDDANVFLLRKYFELYFHFQTPYDPEPRYSGQIVDLHKLETLLAKRGMKVTTLARKAGLNKNIVARICNRQRGARPATVKRLASVLGVEPADLLED